MPLRNLAAIFWIAAFLCFGELMLEIRAWRRGWPTPLFGGGQGAEKLVDADYGPAPGFPFRSRRIPVERNPERIRIWIASSSFAEDVLHPPDAIFPSLTEARLTAMGRPADVLNASRGGLSIVANVDELELLGGRWAPTIAVLYQMSNDVDEISREVLSGAGEGGLKLPLEQPATASAFDLNAVVDDLFESTVTYAQLKNQISARLTRARILLDDVDAVADDIFEARVLRFLDACAELGIRPVICTFATSHLEAEIENLPADSANNLYRYNPHLSVRGWMRSVERWNRLLKEIAAREGVLLIDVAGEVAGRAELFRDFTHFAVDGHVAVAEVLARGLEGL